MKEEKLVLLSEYNSVMEAEIAKSMLESADIYATIGNEYMSSIYPIGAMPARLMVKEEDVDRAVAMLNHR